jgi:hypothetical protein
MTREPSSRRWFQSETRVLLSSLGDDPSLIASKLETLGVRATPRDPHGCAVAVFLHAALAGDPAIASVSVTDKEVVLKIPRRWRRSVRVGLPGPLRHFIKSFDAGMFPALVHADGESGSRTPVHQASPGT